MIEAGQRFGNLVAVAFARKDAKRNSYWRFTCDCGNQTDVRVDAVTSGHTQSCCGKGAQKRHGHASKGNRTPEYEAWRSMLRRRYSANSQNYSRYGGRGITVCDSWRNSFEAFFLDIGSRPSVLHSIDRINNDGNYEPTNVQWATQTQQARNTKNVRTVELDGKLMSLAEAAEITGVHRATLASRLKANRGLK